MAWIELHQTLPTHGKLLDFADAMNLPEYAAVGLMAMFWMWSLDNAPDGQMPNNPRRIARAVRWDGDAEELVSAMIEAGFLEVDGANLRIHNWHNYAGRLIEQRNKNAERQQRHRDRNAKVTPQVIEVESRSSLHNAHVTVTSPSRNTATVPNQTVPNPPSKPPQGQREQGERTDSGTDTASSTRSESETLDSVYRAEPAHGGTVAEPAPADKRGCRLPAGWMPPPEERDKIAAQFPNLDLDLALECFRDYWQAAPGQKGVKLDWLATWRNWMRNADERGQCRKNGAQTNHTDRYPSRPTQPTDYATGPKLQDLTGIGGDTPIRSFPARRQIQPAPSTPPTAAKPGSSEVRQ